MLQHTPLIDQGYNEIIRAGVIFETDISSTVEKDTTIVYDQ